MAEKIEIVVGADVSGFKEGMNEMRDDYEAFNRRIRDEKGIKLSLDAARIKADIESVRLKIKEASTAGERLALNGELIRLQKESASAQRALINYARTGNEAVSVLGKNFGKLNETIKSQSGILDFAKGKFMALAAAAWAAVSASSLAKLSEEYTSIANSLRQVTSEENLPSLIGKVWKAASDSRVPVLEYAQAFSRYDSIIKNMGGTQEETFKILDTLSKWMAASGRSAQETASVMLQLSQAFGSGKLAGDEFRAVSEAMPWILDILAKSMGVPRGALKDLASEGEITSEILKKALLGANKEMNDAFDKSATTIPQAMVKVRNSITLAFGKFDENVGFTEGVVSAIEKVGEFGESLLWIANDVVPAVSSGFSDLFESLKGVFGSIAEGWGLIMDFVSSKTTESNEISIVSWEFLGRAVWAVLSVIGQGINAIVAGLKIAGNVLGRFIAFGIEAAGDFWRWFLGIFQLIPETAARAFVALGQLVAAGVAKAANMAIRAINELIELANKVPGVNIGKLGEIGFAKGFDAKILIPQDSIDKITASASQIGAKFTGAFEWVGEDVSDIFLDMVAQWESAFEKIQNLRAKNAEQGKKTTEQAVEDVRKKIDALWAGDGKKKKKGGKSQEEKDAEKAEKEAKKRREELDEADRDSWDRMRKRREEGYKELVDANRKNYEDVAKLADAYDKFGEKIKDVSEKSAEEIKKIDEQVAEFRKNLEELGEKKWTDLGQRLAGVMEELKDAKESLNVNGGMSGEEYEDLKNKIAALEAEKALIEANTTAEQRKEGGRLAGRSKAQEIIEEYEASKKKIEQDVAEAEARKVRESEQAALEIANLKAKQDAVALAIANENALIIRQDEERRKIEEEFTKFFGKQIEGRRELLQSLIESAKEARSALSAVGISSATNSESSSVSEKWKTAYISVTNNSNVDAESFLRNLDNLVR